MTHTPRKSAQRRVTRVSVQGGVPKPILEEKLEERRLSKQYLASMAGVSRQRVCDYLAGRLNKCGKTNAEKIEKVLLAHGVIDDPTRLRAERSRQRFTKAYLAFHGARPVREKLSMQQITARIEVMSRTVPVFDVREFLHSMDIYPMFELPYQEMQ